MTLPSCRRTCNNAPGAVAEVARGQVAQHPVRGPLAGNEQQHRGDVVHALVVVHARVGAVHRRRRQHPVQRLSPLIPLRLRPPCSPEVLSDGQMTPSGQRTHQ